jgi:hypothetical protein
MLRTAVTVPALFALSLVAAGCCLVAPQRGGGLEGWTMDTPEQAFAYFREAAALGRHDLEFACYSKEFLEKHGFTLDDYLRGRPHVYGETKDLLEALMKAEIAGVEYLAPNRARLDLASGTYRCSVLLIRKPYYRIGLEGVEQPLEGDLDDLRRLLAVRGDHLLVDVPLDLEVWGAMGGMPQPDELTRVEVANRWLLLDVGRVLDIRRMDDKSSGSEVQSP